jgi:hypothetical protein
VNLAALGLGPIPVLDAPVPEEEVPPPPVVARPRDERAAGLRSLGLLLTAWGLLLELLGAASWLGYGPLDDGFGPTRVGRSQVFAASGAMLAVAGAWVGLASLDRPGRSKTLARSVEAAALGLGLSVLVVGIVFHDTRRDPWIVAAVVLAAASARAARHWSRPEAGAARPFAPR